MTITSNRLLLIVAAILFAIAGFALLFHASLPVEALALFGFACWSGSGAL